MFNSTLTLKVYARGSGEVPDRVLGFTPSRHGHSIRVPAEGIWYVRPLGSLDAPKIKHLARLMKEERVPGLDLSDHWEITNDNLVRLASVESMVK